MPKYISKIKYLLLIALFVLYSTYFFSKTYVASPTLTESDFRVAAILGSEENFFWKTVWQALRKEADSSHLLLSEYFLNNNASLDSSFEALEMVFLAKPDGIILCQSRVPDEEYCQLLAQLKEEGAKIVTIDTDLPGSYSDAYIGVDNEQIGKELAEFLVQNYDDRKIVLLSYDGTMAKNLESRLEGVVQTLESHGLQDKIESLVLPSGSDNIMSQLQSYFEEEQEPVWILSVASLQTLYTARTIAALDLTDRVQLVGFGETEEAMRYVEDDVIKALVIQDTRTMGKLAVQAMAQLLSKETPTSKITYVNAAILDKNNVKDYLNL